MNKRGLVTLFIIVAVVIVAVAVLGVFLWPNISDYFMSEQQSRAFLATESERLTKNVQDCVESASRDIFGKIGFQAGYYDYSHLPAINYTTEKVIVMRKNADSFRVNELPGLNKIEQEFSLALNTEGYAKIDRCLNNFDDFKRKIDVEPGSRVITADIRDDDILIKTNWPITVKKGRASAILQQKDVILLIPLGKIWRVANDIVSYEVNQTEFEWVIEQYIKDHDFLLHGYITIPDSPSWPTSEQRIFFVVTNPLDRIDGVRPGEESYEFHFAVNRS